MFNKIQDTIFELEKLGIPRDQITITMCPITFKFFHRTLYEERSSTGFPPMEDGTKFNSLFGCNFHSNHPFIGQIVIYSLNHTHRPEYVKVLDFNSFMEIRTITPVSS